jgi:hypothetical protein
VKLKATLPLTASVAFLYGEQIEMNNQAALKSLARLLAEIAYRQLKRQNVVESQPKTERKAA